MLLGLAFAVGVSFLPQEASAQNRNTWRHNFGTFISTGVSGTVPGTVGSKSITIFDKLNELMDGKAPEPYASCASP